MNHHRSSLSLAFRLAMCSGQAKSNPARATRHRKEDNSRVRYLSAEEEARLRSAIVLRWPEHIPELDLARHSGMRLTEMYGLYWGNVNFPQRLLTIPRNKNGERRYVRANSTAPAALLAFLAGSDGAGPVIRTIRGERLCGPRYCSQRALREAKIEGFHWHDLRHPFASRLVMAGVNLRAVPEGAGAQKHVHDGSVCASFAGVSAAGGGAACLQAARDGRCGTDRHHYRHQTDSWRELRNGLCALNLLHVRC